MKQATAAQLIRLATFEKQGFAVGESAPAGHVIAQQAAVTTLGKDFLFRERLAAVLPPAESSTLTASLLLQSFPLPP